jgi:hypothetical protein
MELCESYPKNPPAQDIFYELHMIHYYINPKTHKLIACNDESKEITELERVGEASEAEEEDKKPAGYGSNREKWNKKFNREEFKKGQKPRTCSLCHMVGHRSDRCAESGQTVPKRSGKPDEATIQRIRELHDEGKTIGEIKAVTGCSYATINRYRKYTPEPYEPENEPHESEELDADLADDGEDQDWE